MSLKGLEIDSFIPWYPDISDKDFQRIIASKKEFNDLTLEPTEDIPLGKGEYLNHQIFIQRFMNDKTVYNENVLIHSVGTGKSCTVFALSEHLKNISLDNNPRPKALVLAQGELLLNNLKNELVNVCSKPGAYQPRKEDIISEESNKIRTTKLINNYYEFSTYETFIVNHVSGRKKSTNMKEIPAKSDSYIKENYSNRLIIIDEVHNIRLQKGKKESSILYNGIYRFLHTVENCKILLLTATPQWDNVEETAPLMNLILPLDNQLPTGKEFTDRYITKDGDIKNKDELKKILSGRISYLRQQSSVAKKIYEGQRKPWLKYTTVYPDIMSDFQADIVNQASKRGRKKDLRSSDVAEEEESEESANGLHQYEREASNIVFPDGTYGDEALKKHLLLKKEEKAKFTIKTKDKVYGFKNRKVAEEMANNLYKYSAKFAFIIDDIISHPNDPIFVYMSFIKNSGLIVLCLLLLEVAHQRKIKYVQIKKKGELLPNIRGFGLITSQTTSASEARDIISTFNTLENTLSAKNCQVIFGSKMVAQGISLKGVRRLHIGNPHWNESLTDQAEGRVFRLGSHTMLLKNQQYVDIFYHASVYNNKGKPSKKMSIDLTLYKTAEDKGYRITKMRALEKEVSEDCALNYMRNVSPADIESNKISIDAGLGPIKECDYRENCNYVCDTMKPTNTKGELYSYKIPEKEITKDTYNLYYSKDKILSIIERISNIFMTRFSISISDLKVIIQEDLPLILLALDTMIEERILLRDKYGFPVYVKEESDIVFLVRNIADKSLYENSYYVANPYFTEKTSLDALVEVAKIYTDRDKVDKFCKFNLKLKNAKVKLLKLIESMDYRVRIILIESCYKEYHTNKHLSKESKEKCKIVLDAYGSNIYKLKNGDVAHIMYYTEFAGSSYNITSKLLKAEGLARCFNPERKEMTSPQGSPSTPLLREPEWTYCPQNEEEKILEEIKSLQNKKRDIGFEGNPYGMYGTLSTIDGQFRVVIKPEEGKAPRKGITCTKIPDKPRIIDYLLKTDYKPKIKEDIKKLGKQRLIMVIKNLGKKISKETSENIDGMTEDELKHLLAIATMEKPELCKALQDFFESKGLLYRI